MASSKDIKEKVLWIIDSKQNEKSGGGTDLRVIQWIIDGKPNKPMLEKRDWYLDENGDRKIGKAKGMTAFDLVKVITNLPKICRLLEMKSDALDEALQLAMMQNQNPNLEPRPASATPPKTSSASSTPKPQSQPEPAMAGAPPEIEF